MDYFRYHDDLWYFMLISSNNESLISLIYVIIWFLWRSWLIIFEFGIIYRDATAYVAEIINTVGMESAKAQGLNQAVTTAERLRNSEDQIIYLMTEDNEDKK